MSFTPQNPGLYSVDYLEVIALGATNCSVIKCTGIGKGRMIAVPCEQVSKLVETAINEHTLKLIIFRPSVFICLLMKHNGPLHNVFLFLSSLLAMLFPNC